MYDDFERAALGPSWQVAFPSPDTGATVDIINSTALGRKPAASSFYIADYVARTFTNNQWAEATFDAAAPMDQWVNAVNVRRDPRFNPAPRYIWVYDFGDTGDEEFNDQWVLKYDGVAPADVEYLASIPGPVPVGGDTIRLEIKGYTLSGYHNGVLILQTTHTNIAKRISEGRPGVCGRRTFGDGISSLPNLQTEKIWKSFRAGDL